MFHIQQFQFHKGTIRTLLVLLTTLALRHFNSIKVRLELVSGATGLASNLHFNSIKVRLERLQMFVRLLLMPYFNSIKVRLERTLLSGEKGQKPQFQFHKGTIRTRHAHVLCVEQENFNSIKVRLERWWTFPLPSYYRFQFHKGTIRTLYPS